MKPNCFFSRLDQSNFKNGYYKILMGLTSGHPQASSFYGGVRVTEDILGLASFCLRQFEKITNDPGGFFYGQFGWDVNLWYRQGALRTFFRGNCQKTWRTLSENQLPNLCEEQ